MAEPLYNISKNTILLNAVFNKVLEKVGSGKYLKLYLTWADDTMKDKSLAMFFYYLRVENSRTYKNYLEFISSAPAPSRITLDDALYQLNDLRILQANYFEGGHTIDGPAPEQALVDEIAQKLYDYSYNPTPPADVIGGNK